MMLVPIDVFTGSRLRFALLTLQLLRRGTRSRAGNNARGLEPRCSGTSAVPDGSGDAVEA